MQNDREGRRTLLGLIFHAKAQKLRKGAFALTLRLCVKQLLIRSGPQYQRNVFSVSAHIGWNLVTKDDSRDRDLTRPGMKGYQHEPRNLVEPSLHVRSERRSDPLDLRH